MIRHWLVCRFDESNSTNRKHANEKKKKKVNLQKRIEQRQNDIESKSASIRDMTRQDAFMKNKN